MSTVKTKIVELPTFEQLNDTEKAKVIETLTINEYTFNRETLRLDS